MSKSFFGRHALLVLIIVYFCIPFALRGSRYAVQRMKNDVKDWLPTSFKETGELDWFRERFLGEQFVVISWDGCMGTADDLRFRKFVDGLFPEKPPSVVRSEEELKHEAGAPLEEPTYVDEDLDLYVRSFVPATANQEETFIGNKLELFYDPGKDHFNWGGRKEKWMRAGKNGWVVINEKGKLFQWKGNQTWPAQLWRGISRAATGQKNVEFEEIAFLGIEDGPWYYEDPSRLNARLVKSVTSGPSVLNQLTSGKLGLDRDEAHERLRGVLFGDDDEHTCIVVTLTDAAKDDPRALVGRGMLGRERGFLLDVAEEAGVQPPIPPPALPGFLVGLFGDEPEVSGDPMLRMGGPPVDNAAIDEEGQVTLARLLGLSLAVGLGLSWLCFRSINITVMVFLVGGFSAVTSVGIIYWTGSQLDAVLMSMPSLVYVLGISGAVHVVNYYRESVAEKGIASAPDNAVKLGFWPCTMAAFTTSLGLFFRQKRVGLNGKCFMMIKFRSMYQNAEVNGPQLSSENDSRITKWGRIMRKYRLDELPQFLNVILGEMSIVGPRPERAYFLNKIGEKAPHVRHIQKVKPGITSWGMVKYGYAENVDEMVQRLKYDIIYIENMNLFNDLKILIYTVLIVLQGRGK